MSRYSHESGQKWARHLIRNPETAGNVPHESTITYGYDAGNRLNSIVDSLSGTITAMFDNLDRLQSETNPQGSISYTYDSADRRATATVAGQPLITYSFDAANRLYQIVQGTSTTSIGYDNDNRRNALTLPNGLSQSYGYDAASRLTGITYLQGSNTLANLSYGYDAASRRTSMGGSFSRTGFPTAVASATYDVANELTNWNGTTITYDANGNMQNDGVNAYSWDARNQLSSRAGLAFQYDGAGRRYQNAAGTKLLFDGINVAQELTSGTPSANLVTGGVDEFFNRTDSGGLFAPLTDGLGSVLGLSNSSGAIQTQYTYDPFGNTATAGSGGSNTFQYTSRENDGNGLYYYRARYYSPGFSRFISEDPIGFLGGVNQYSYAANNPLIFRDPFGTSICPIHIAETAAAFTNVGLGGVSVPAGVAVCTEDVRGQGTSVFDTRRHAMAGRKQSCDDAYNLTRDFVNNSDDPFAAIHAIQDSYASGHQYQSWAGGFPSYDHLKGDSVYIPAAEAATERYLRDFLNNRVQDASAYLYPEPCI